MKKLILAAAVLLLFSGCGTAAESEETEETPAPAVQTEQAEQTEQTEKGEQGEQAEQPAETSHTAAEILDMVSESGICPALDARAELGEELFGRVCENLYGVPADDLTQGGILFVEAGTIADEVSVLAGEGDMTALLEARAQLRVNDYKGYAPEESAKAEKAQVFEHDGFSILVIADNAEEIKQKILDF